MDPQRKLMIILNPIAGKGHAPKHIPTINAYLQNYNMNYEIHVTKYSGHAIELAEKFSCQENNIIVAAGGDGTCNEVINGLIRTKLSQKDEQYKPVFGVLPIGRGNDFAYGAGIANNLKDCLSDLVHGEPVNMDVGLIKGGDYPQGRFFGNGIGVGFDTIVGLEAAKLKHIRGAAGYILSALKTLIIYPAAPDVEVKYNEVTLQVSPAIVSIMNGNRMGGTFYMAPNANNNDGVLNMCLTEQGSRGQLLKTMMHYVKGTQHNLDNTTTVQSSHFSISAINGTLAVHADGETICEAGKELVISCIPNALQIINKA